MTDHLMPYMLYSREIGPEECACLAFAHSGQEARKVGWNNGCKYDIADEYIDLVSRPLGNRPWLLTEADPQKFSRDEAHLVFAPNTCRWCESWGHIDGPISRDGLFPRCMKTKYGELGEEIMDEILAELAAHVA